MSGDYKYDIYLLAEEIAEEQYGTDYYSLSNDKQMEVYGKAMNGWSDQRASAADFARSAAKERFIS